MISGVKEIITDEVALSRRAVEIDTIHEGQLLREITKALKRTLSKTEGLYALSAPAIGYQKRVFCIKFDKDDIKTFINPVIGERKGLELSRETCSSIPGKEYIIPRNNDIDVMYQRPTGQPEGRQLLGKAAMVFQHECDHLDGVIISDIGLEVLPGFDKASKKVKNEIISEYLDSLDIKLSQVKKEIEEDPELKQIVDAANFISGVKSGEIKQTID